MTAPDLIDVGNHLWQSTVFAVAAALLTLTLKQNRAAVHYWVWFAASVKFLVPFSALETLGRQLEWRTAPALVQPRFTAVVTQLSSPFDILPAQSLPTPTEAAFPFATALFAIWLTGVVAGLLFWFRLWRKTTRIRREATPLALGLLVPVLQAAPQTRLEPAVFGILKPVLIVPAGLTDTLTPDQLQAVLTHELHHVRRRDNLTAAIHMLVELLFWFHPLVWWLRRRLIAERERACDEAVAAQIRDPRTYAEALLSVCKLCVGSPLPCVSGITGSELKSRIESILNNRTTLRLSTARKAALTLAGVSALAIPLVTGVINAPFLRAEAAQTEPSGKLAFEVASIRTAVTPGRGPAICLTPCTPGQRFTVNGSRLEIRFMPVSTLLERAYRVHPYQISGPASMKERKFDISAKIPAGVSPDRIPEMLQTLLAERFGVALHRETKVMSVLALVVGKDGIKLDPAAPDAATQPPPGPKALKMFTPDGDAHMDKGRITLNSALLGPVQSLGNGKWELMGITMPGLAQLLMADEDRPVIDETNLPGAYRLVYEINVPEGKEGGEMAGVENPVRASLRQAIGRGGLRLERRNAPIETLVIDRVEKLPTAN